MAERQPKQRSRGGSDDHELLKQSTEEEKEEGSSNSLECAVCLQSCVHPVQLPCCHIFCFLCVKGVANQSKRCAMCRQEIPADYMDRPHLVNQSELEKDTAFDDGYQWFYEGHNGWWQYDERTSKELETDYKKGKHNCELLIAGFLYVIDFDDMIQMRRNDPSRRRRIKRDLASIPKKGVAGLRLEGQSNREGADGEGTDDDTGASGASSNLRIPNSRLRVKSPSPSPAPPTNTPQTPHTPSANSIASSPEQLENRSLHQAIEEIERLHLDCSVFHYSEEEYRGPSVIWNWTHSSRNSEEDFSVQESPVNHASNNNDGFVEQEVTFYNLDLNESPAVNATNEGDSFVEQELTFYNLDLNEGTESQEHSGNGTWLVTVSSDEDQV